MMRPLQVIVALHRRRLLSKSIAHKIIYILASSIFIVIALEALLRFTDPLGIWRYRSLNLFYSQYVVNSEPTGYDFADGTHTGVGHTFTIENGNRRLPDRGEDCTIAFLGDSFAFGWGVDDEQIYPYLLAQEFDRVTFINTGRPAYSMANIMLVVDDVQADGYVWFIVENDDAPIATAYGNPPHILWRSTAIRTYLDVSQRNSDVDYYNIDGFAEDVIQLTGRDDLIAFGYGRLAEIAGVNIIPEYDYISPGDHHPDANGHAQIADLMLPKVRDLISQVCGETYAEIE